MKIHPTTLYILGSLPPVPLKNATALHRIREIRGGSSLSRLLW